MSCLRAKCAKCDAVYTYGSEHVCAKNIVVLPSAKPKHEQNAKAAVKKVEKAKKAAAREKKSKAKRAPAKKPKRAAREQSSDPDA